jgi:hypothetical protein
MPLDIFLKFSTNIVLFLSPCFSYFSGKTRFESWRLIPCEWSSFSAVSVQGQCWQGNSIYGTRICSKAHCLTLFWPSWVWFNPSSPISMNFVILFYSVGPRMFSKSGLLFRRSDQKDCYCNGFDQRVATQQLCKYGPTRNNMGSCAFCRSDRRANRLAG